MITVSFCLLFLASVYSSHAQTPDTGADADQETAEVSVRAGAPLELRCRLHEAGRGAEWQREGGTGTAVGRAREEVAGGRLWAVLRVADRARPHHAGLYTCARPPAPPHTVRVRVSDVVAGEEEPAVQYYDVHRPFQINCTLPNPSGLPVLWSKNGTDVSLVPELAGRADVRGHALDVRGKSTDDDHGAYRCTVGNLTRDTELRGRPVAKLPPHAAAVEGQALRLRCRVVGRPAPPAVWTFANDTHNGTDAAAALGADRVELRPGEGGAADAELVVAAARRSDAGRYTCTVGASSATTTVRVKDMYAALWPFLGICAEVVLLCAVILIYERRRNKNAANNDDEDDHKKS